jgi:hypothetical protein
VHDAHRLPKWTKFKVWGHELWKRIGFKKAEIAVARKLAIILHRMRRNGTDFLCRRRILLSRAAVFAETCRFAVMVQLARALTPSP